MGATAPLPLPPLPPLPLPLPPLLLLLLLLLPKDGCGNVPVFASFPILCDLLFAFILLLLPGVLVALLPALLALPGAAALLALKARGRVATDVAEAGAAEGVRTATGVLAPKPSCSCSAPLLTMASTASTDSCKPQRSAMTATCDGVAVSTWPSGSGMLIVCSEVLPAPWERAVSAATASRIPVLLLARAAAAPEKLEALEVAAADSSERGRFLDALGLKHLAASLRLWLAPSSV